MTPKPRVHFPLCYPLDDAINHYYFITFVVGRKEVVGWGLSGECGCVPDLNQQCNGACCIEHYPVWRIMSNWACSPQRNYPHFLQVITRLSVPSTSNPTHASYSVKELFISQAPLIRALRSFVSNTDSVPSGSTQYGLALDLSFIIVISSSQRCCPGGELKLDKHFCLFISPLNIFVPKFQYGALGQL